MKDLFEAMDGDNSKDDQPLNAQQIDALGFYWSGMIYALDLLANGIAPNEIREKIQAMASKLFPKPQSDC